MMTIFVKFDDFFGLYVFNIFRSLNWVILENMEMTIKRCIKYRIGQTCMHYTKNNLIIFLFSF
jgi:pyruvate carboxylase